MTLEDDHAATATGQVVSVSQPKDSRAHHRVVVTL